MTDIPRQPRLPRDPRDRFRVVVERYLSPTATPSPAPVELAPPTARPSPDPAPLVADLPERRLWTRAQCIARYNREWVAARGARPRRERAAPAREGSET